jgi:hypothetical protein
VADGDWIAFRELLSRILSSLLGPGANAGSQLAPVLGSSHAGTSIFRGRAGCGPPIDPPFAFFEHARIRVRADGAYVENLGNLNRA